MHILINSKIARIFPRDYSFISSFLFLYGRYIWQ
uniref:Uncharacterized protein n=1 Tax=Manihot esculenta TaxID=3983 RepID=A0A2C9ULR2_MANES